MGSLRDINLYASMLLLSLRQHLGRRFYLIPWLVSVWPIYHAVRMLESGQVRFYPADAQNELIGLPIYLLAIGMGIRIIANEVEQHTLEVAYTIPGGAVKIWAWKIVSSLFIIVCALLLLAGITWTLFTPFPLGVLYRVLQGATFFLVFAMAAGALLKSELAAAVVSVTLLFILYPRFYGLRWSPIFDPLHADIFGDHLVGLWLLQNHVWVFLLSLLIVLYAFVKVEQREVFFK